MFEWSEWNWKIKWNASKSIFDLQNELIKNDEIIKTQLEIKTYILQKVSKPLVVEEEDVSPTKKSII